ncbi:MULTISPECIES: GNAT family N-acetyltransferase, partial [Streptomyces]
MTAVEMIRTVRLELVPLEVGHAEEMVGVLGDPALHRSWGGAPLGLVGRRARYARWAAGAPEPGTGWCNWVVREREGGHAEEMGGVLGDPARPRFMGGAPAGLEGLRARYARWAAGAPEPGTSWCNWVVREREGGRLVGTVQATVAGGVAEVAWVVGTAWQGRGYASEAARALVGWLRPR